LAGACLILIAAAPTQAEESSCPDAISSFDTNGGVLSIPRGGAGRTLDILAIGSSSTEGIGASSAANAYPARLQDELAKDDGIAVDVKNAGIGGELAAKTLQRLKSALKSGWARLVIWQVGTNDAIVGVDEALFRATVKAGIEAARAAGVPLVLVGPQVTLIPTDPARYERFVAIVDEIGATDHVPVLDRYVLMKSWGVKNAMALVSLLSYVGLLFYDLVF
jgi:acyl-CoA thioesterase I